MQNSPDFGILYAEGINNIIEEDSKRKEAKRTQSTMLPSLRNFDDFEESNTASKNARMYSVLKPGLERHDSELLLHERERPEKAFFESQDGGMVSADGTEIYFMGIIDILTNFGKKKRMENILRSIVHNPRTISCIPPEAYGNRFYEFMTQKVFLSQEEIKRELKAREAKLALETERGKGSKK